MYDADINTAVAKLTKHFGFEVVDVVDRCRVKADKQGNKYNALSDHIRAVDSRIQRESLKTGILSLK